MRALQAMLALYGYGLDLTGVYDRRTRAVVTAFQRHFRPGRVDGEANRGDLFAPLSSAYVRLAADQRVGPAAFARSLARGSAPGA